MTHKCGYDTKTTHVEMPKTHTQYWYDTKTTHAGIPTTDTYIAVYGNRLKRHF